MTPFSDPTAIVFTGIEALPERVVFPCVVFGTGLAIEFPVGKRVSVWNKVARSDFMMSLVGTAIVKSTHEVRYPQVLEFASVYLDVLQHGFQKKASMRHWMAEMLEDRYGGAATMDGAPYTVVHIKAV